MRWRAIARAALSEVEAAERERCRLRADLALRGAALFAASERAEETSAELQRTNDLLSERSSALRCAQREASEYLEALKGAKHELAALRGQLAKCEAELAGASERGGRSITELPRIQRLLAEMGVELEHANDKLSNLGKKLEIQATELAETRERAKETAVELRRARDALAERDAALGHANDQLAALHDKLAARNTAPAKADDRTEEDTTQSGVVVNRPYAPRAPDAVEPEGIPVPTADEPAAPRHGAVHKLTQQDPVNRPGRREPETRPNKEKEGKIRKRLTSDAISSLENGTWRLYVEDEFSPNGSVSSLQPIIAAMNPVRDGVYGPISDPSVIREFAPDGALIFRMTGDCSARRCRTPPAGLHFAIVPATWRYIESESGPPPADPQDCGIPGYVLHYFSLDWGLPIVFDRSDGAVFKIEKIEYQIGGRLLPDVQERMGPIFVDRPPCLSSDRGGFDGVQTVVIGHEGPEKGKWSASYPCEPQHNGRWRLPNELGTGWYFLRLYDVDDKLVESLTFRYIRGLVSES